MKALVLMLMVATLAGAQWMQTATVNLELNQWNTAGSDWALAGMPNIKVVMRDIPGQGNKPCTEISWQHTDFSGVIADNPQGENWWRPQTASEGRCFYLIAGQGYIRAWEYPFAPMPQYKILYNNYENGHYFYVGYVDYLCLPVEPASVGTIKACYGVDNQ